MNTTLPSRPTGLRNFALIDSNLPDLATLCAGLPSDCGIIWFDGALQGIDAIAQQFNQHAAIDRLHVITHGAPGKLFFGNTTLSQDTLADHAETIEQIRQALSATAELYLYACELAQGAAGQAFVQALRELIGLPIAAATHKVGHNELGGDWSLDVMPAMQSSALQVPAWNGVLAPQLFTRTLPLLLSSDNSQWNRPNYDNAIPKVGATENNQIGTFSSVINQVDMGAGYTPYNYAFVSFTVSEAGTYSFKIIDTTLEDAVILLV